MGKMAQKCQPGFLSLLALTGQRRNRDTFGAASRSTGPASRADSRGQRPRCALLIAGPDGRAKARDRQIFDLPACWIKCSSGGQILSFAGTGFETSFPKLTFWKTDPKSEPASQKIWRFWRKARRMACLEPRQRLAVTSFGTKNVRKCVRGSKSPPRQDYWCY